jgi:acetyl esterase/lipase
MPRKKMPMPNPSPSLQFPKPDRADAPYGQHRHQTLDLYLPAGSGPFPLVVFIHGGGWIDGDKVGRLRIDDVQQFRSRGCAVASINYRFARDGSEAGLWPPVLAPLHDAKCAVQYLRFMAAEWNLDATKVAVYGGSAGAFSALWLGLSPDFAEPAAQDPVARMSTRVKAIGAINAQTSLDPRQMREWVGPALCYGGHAFGLDGLTPAGFAQFLARRDEFAEWYPRLSPASLLAAGAPPILLHYDLGLNDPRQDADYHTHSPKFGIGFQALARTCGLTCHLRYQGSTDEGPAGVVEFMADHLHSAEG